MIVGVTPRANPSTTGAIWVLFGARSNGNPVVRFLLRTERGGSA